MADHADIDHSGLTGIPSTTAPNPTTIELGHASDTTLSRASAGVVAVEGTNLVKAGAVTSSGLTQATARILGRTTASAGAIEEITVGSGLSLSAGSLTATGSASPIASGTSFPGSPSNNDLFYRTDHDIIFFYDGTRWLCTCPHETAFGVGQTTFGLGTSGQNAGRLPIAATALAGLDLWLLGFVTAAYVSATNDGSNYWIMTLAKVTGNDAHTTIVNPNTSAYSAATWTDAWTSIGASVAAGSHELLDVVLTKSGTPGNIFWAGKIHYRLLGT